VHDRPLQSASLVGTEPGPEKTKLRWINLDAAQRQSCRISRDELKKIADEIDIDQNMPGQ
jgi:hypothetical protein